jgi:hypothetical protein
VALREALRMPDAWTGSPLVPPLVGGLLVILGVAYVWGPAAPALARRRRRPARRRVAVLPSDAFWQFQQDELKKYLPLATKMRIRK